jgi:hypothetical protein
MVSILTVERLDMQRDAGVHGEGLEPLANQFRIELSDLFDPKLGPEHEERPTRDVDRDSRQGLIHRQVDVGIAADAALVRQSLGEGLSQRDARIFHRMMVIDMKITRHRHVEVEQRVTREQLEHVVEKADTRRDLGPTRPVEVEGDLHVGLRRLAADAGGAVGLLGHGSVPVRGRARLLEGRPGRGKGGWRRIHRRSRRLSGSGPGPPPRRAWRAEPGRAVPERS